MADVPHTTRLQKAKTSGKHVHQKPLRKKPPLKELPNKPAEPAPSVKSADAPPLRTHSFLMKNLEQQKSSPAHSFKNVIKKLLPKKPAQVHKQKMAQKKLESNKLSPMAKRVYYGIANALSGE